MQIPEYTLPETNIAPENQWLKDWISFWDGLFSEALLVSRAMLVSRRVYSSNKIFERVSDDGRVSFVFP